MNVENMPGKADPKSTEVATVPVLASGGVGSVEDLRALAECGAAGAVVGMALYTGALDARAVAEEFGGG